MFRLTREVRFAINPQGDGQPSAHNGFGGSPALLGIGHYFALEVPLVGEPDDTTGCIRNIKEIDKAVRNQAVPLVAQFVRSGRFEGGGSVVSKLYELLMDAWAGSTVDQLLL